MTASFTSTDTPQPIYENDSIYLSTLFWTRVHFQVMYLRRGFTAVITKWTLDFWIFLKSLHGVLNKLSYCVSNLFLKNYLSLIKSKN